jgi:arylsulfatase A-like enzyme
MKSRSESPNILWICTDQQRFDTIHALGNNHIRTPNLDRLAKEGVSFENAYCQCPVCTPSRGSFLTGRYPHTMGLRQNGQDIPQNEVLVTKVLADNGYTCGLSGKLHICGVDTRDEEPRVNDGYEEFHWAHGPFPVWKNNQYIRWLHRQGKEWDEIYPYASLSARFGREGVTPENRPVWAGVPTELHHATWCTDRAIDFIKKHRSGPWLFSLNFQDPHHPFDPPQEYLERYDPDRIPPPNYREGELEGKTILQRVDHEGAYGGRGMSFAACSERQHREVIAAYYAMVELIDHNVGRLVEVLEESGQLEDTIILFMSDHGEMLGDHGIFLKGPHMYEPLVKVPLIVSWANYYQRGLRSPALVELIDVAPTLLDAAGLAPFPRMQGRSLSNLCRGESDPSHHRDYAFSEFYNTMIGYRDLRPCVTMYRSPRYKLIHYSGLDRGELYDLQEDPFEYENLWISEEFRDLREEYTRKCLDATVFTADPWPERTRRF